MNLSPKTRLLVHSSKPRVLGPPRLVLILCNCLCCISWKVKEKNSLPPQKRSGLFYPSHNMPHSSFVVTHQSQALIFQILRPAKFHLPTLSGSCFRDKTKNQYSSENVIVQGLDLKVHVHCYLHFIRSFLTSL